MFIISEIQCTENSSLEKMINVKIQLVYFCLLGMD